MAIHSSGSFRLILLLISLLCSTDAQYGPPQFPPEPVDPQQSPQLGNMYQPAISSSDLGGPPQPSENSQQLPFLSLALFQSPSSPAENFGAVPGQGMTPDAGSQPSGSGPQDPARQQSPPQSQMNPRGQSPQPPTSNGIPSVNDIMDFIHKKYHDLFPSADSAPPPDSGPLFPLPDLKSVSDKVPKNGFFYSFSPLHMQALNEVREILRG